MTATPATIATTIHQYRFDVSKDGERREYTELRRQLVDTPGRGCCHNVLVIPGAERLAYSGPIELETRHLFDNQWNTAKVDGDGSEYGWRVFDWYEAVCRNPNIKSGHYLDITPEMIDIRRRTLICGYCGKHEPDSTGKRFCGNCLDSKYLQKNELHLLRLVPADGSVKRTALTNEERAELEPIYAKAQIHGATKRGKNRLKERREQIRRNAREAINHARVKRDGELWLLDHGIETDNAIYYSHTGVFSFGWRQKLDANTAADLEKRLAEEGFPWAFEIKTHEKQES